MQDSPSPEDAAFERYEILGEIAHGGMGVVFRVKDLELDRILALKRLSNTASGSNADVTSDLFARFLEEVQVTAQLDHPAIVPVHDLGFDRQGVPFYTMRYVKGRHLGEIIRLARAREEGWNLPRLIEVMVRVCQALTYAHGKGVLHRDLKPRNIMVGDLGEVYVMDWGLARMLGREDVHNIRLRTGTTDETISGAREGKDDVSIDAPLRTMDGAVVGTPAYMAPEQANGLIAEVNHQSDIYSIGAILYQLLVGRPPYVKGKETTPRAVLSELGQGPPTPVREIEHKAPTELVAICEKAMARRREDRYDSTLALADDLQAFLDTRVVSAYEHGLLAEAKKWIRRNRLWRWAIPSLSLIAIISALAWGQSHRAEKRAVNSLTLAQKSESEANQAREQAEALVDFTLRQIYADLQSVGDLKVLEQVIAKVDAYLDSLPTSSLGRPQTLFLKSLTRHRSALIQRDRGETESALSSMREAVALRERYVETIRDTDALSYLASIYDSLAVMLRETNHLEEAEAVFRKALPIYDKILTEFPNDGNFMHNLANTRNNIGMLAESQKDFESAAASFKEAVLLREKILQIQPNRGIVLFGKAVARGHLARMYCQLGQIEIAIHEAGTAQREIEELLATDTSNALYQIGVALIMRSFIDLHLALGNHDNAREASERMIDLMQHAIAGDPSNIPNQNRLASFQRLYALSVVGRSDLAEEVLSTLQSSLQRLETLMENHSGHIALLEEWVDTSLVAAQLQSATSPARALSLLNKTIALCEKQCASVADYSATATYHWRLRTASAHQEAGRICRQINDSTEATHHLNAAATIFTDLQDQLSVHQHIKFAELQWSLAGPSAPPEIVQGIRDTLTVMDPRLVKRTALLETISP